MGRRVNAIGGEYVTEMYRHSRTYVIVTFRKVRVAPFEFCSIEIDYAYGHYLYKYK